MTLQNLALSTLIAFSVTTHATAEGGRDGFVVSCQDRGRGETYSGEGRTRNDALKAARQLCGEKLMDDFVINNRNLTDADVDGIIETCVNMPCG